MKRLSLRSNIIRFVSLTLAGVIITLGLLLSLYMRSNAKRDLVHQTITTMGFASEHCVVPLVFGDKHAAERVLERFSHIPQVADAIIKDSENVLFAVYNRSDDSFDFPPFTELPSAIYSDGWLFASVAVVDGNDRLGTLYLRVSTEMLAKQQQLFLFYLMLISFPVFGISLIVLHLIALRISGPLLDISEAAEKIESGGDFEIVLSPHSSSEIMRLEESLNSMLMRLRAGESKLEETLQLLHDIVDSSPSLIVVLDSENNILMWNSCAEEFSIKDDLYKKLLFECFPSLRIVGKALLDVHRTRERVLLRSEKIFMRSWDYVDISIFPLQITEGGAVVSISDVTKQYNNESQLIQIQKMETVGVLAGGLAHDFNNVLNGIVATLSLIRFDAEEIPLTEEMDEYITIMEESSKRAAGLISQLLMVSRRKEVKRENVNILDVVKSVYILFSTGVDKSVSLSLIHTGNSFIVNADSAQLEQVFLNICINAAHAMTIMRPDGEHQGGVVSVDIHNVQLLESLPLLSGDVPPGTYVVVNISDSGVGIAQDDILKIFDPFYTTKSVGKGTGLGLSMVLSIVRENGGYLSISSSVGVGTEFQIYFPAVEEFKDLEVIDEPVFHYRETGNVLIIDDDPHVAAIARKILERCGFSVNWCSNGVTGCSFVREQEDISLILLDMVMPEMNGYETYLALQEFAPHIPVILSSGFGEDERVKKTLDIGAKGFVGKPYRVEDFLRVVQSVLNMI